MVPIMSLLCTATAFGNNLENSICLFDNNKMNADKEHSYKCYELVLCKLDKGQHQCGRQEVS